MQNVAWPTMIVNRPALMPNTGCSTFWIDRLQRDTGDDAGQRDRQDHEQVDHPLAEEVEAGQRQREQRPEHERDRRGAECPP